MGSYDRNYSASPADGNGDKKPKLNPANPLDDIVAGLLGTAVAKGRGFTLGVTGADKGDVKISVIESLPLHDDYVAPASYRSHTFDDTPSLVSYAKKYGTPEESIVFIGEEKTVLVLHDRVERGKRERLTLDWRASEDWKEWEALLDEPTPHRKLLKFLQSHEHNLVNPDLLISLSTISATSTVDYQSDMNDMGSSVGVMFKTTKGESLAKFPKKFDITLPVLDEDNDAGHFVQITLNVEVMMPESANDPSVKFRLYTSRWVSVWRERIQTEESYIREGLTGWLTLKGDSGYAAKTVAAD